MKRLVRFGFRLLYNELAFTYDAVAWGVSLGKWQAWGRAALPHLRGRRVLELAHGPGHLLIALSKAALQPIGIDLSPSMGRLAQRRVRGRDIPLVRCRAQALPFRSGWFDSVVATFPTEYIIDPMTLREVARVTQPTGRLVIVAAALWLDRRLSVRLIDWLYRITGQRDAPTSGRESIFKQVGMPIQIVHEAVGAGTVTVVIADKTQAL